MTFRSECTCYCHDPYNPAFGREHAISCCSPDIEEVEFVAQIPPTFDKGKADTRFVNEQIGLLPSWEICPDCGIGKGVDHLKDCPRAGWNKGRR